MARFPEAITRMFHRTFVCRKCKKKIRGNVLKFIHREFACPNCGCRAFRAIKKVKSK